MNQLILTVALSGGVTAPPPLTGADDELARLLDVVAMSDRSPADKLDAVFFAARGRFASAREHTRARLALGDASTAAALRASLNELAVELTIQRPFGFDFPGFRPSSPWSGGSAGCCFSAPPFATTGSYPVYGPGGTLVGHHVFVPLPGAPPTRPVPRDTRLQYSGLFPALPMFPPTPWFPPGSTMPLPRLDRPTKR